MEKKEILIVQDEKTLIEDKNIQSLSKNYYLF